MYQLAELAVWIILVWGMWRLWKNSSRRRGPK